MVGGAVKCPVDARADPQPYFPAFVPPTMEAVKNADSGTWHLVGTRGCGAEPDGDAVEGNWAEIRDRVDRDEGDRCQRCNWPRG